MKRLLKLGKALNRAEQKMINGGLYTFCNYVGDTGQRCVYNSDCTGPGNPVCFHGCCNTVV